MEQAVVEVVDRLAEETEQTDQTDRSEEREASILSPFIRPDTTQRGRLK